MNLALADVRMLSRALEAFYKNGTTDLLDSYSDTCLRRVWKAQRFSWWMTQMFHVFPEESAVRPPPPARGTGLRRHSEAAAKSLAEKYVGLPID